jgi:hypothetical protein
VRPSLIATITVKRPVEVTGAVTRAKLVIHAGHTTHLLGFHSLIVPFSTRPAVIAMGQLYGREWTPWE